MLDILFGHQRPRCDGISRRDFLRIGAVGSMGLTLGRALEGRREVE